MLAKQPGGKRGVVQRAKKHLDQLEISLSCDLCAAEALAHKADPAADVLAYEKAMARLREIKALAYELRLGPTHRNYRVLRKAIIDRLDDERPNWRTSVGGIGQLPAVRRRTAGHSFTDAEILEAFIKGALSGIGGKWGRDVEPALPYLSIVFHDFDLPRLAGMPNANLILAQLRELGVSGPWLAPRLPYLLGAAKALLRRAEQFGSVENYFQALLAGCGDNAVKLAMALGIGRKHKLPGFGIRTAAEALKNCGFDLVKPDIHVNRALACLAIVGFERWKWESDYASPEPSDSEFYYVMLKAEDIADCLGVESVLVDNALWLLCSDKANGGLHLTNAAVEKLGEAA